MAKHLIRRGNTWYVKIAVPRPLWSVIDQKEITRTTGTTDLKLAERRKHAIIAEIRDEIDLRATNSPGSDQWLHTQAMALRKSVQRGELDPEIAADLMGTIRDKHLKATGQDPEVHPLPAEQLTRLVRATRMVTQENYQPLSALVEQYLAERKPHIVASTYGSKERRLQELMDWLKDDPDINEITLKVTGQYVGEELSGNGKAYKTNAFTITTLSGFFNWCIRRGMYEHSNPWTGLIQTLQGSKRGGSKVQLRKWHQYELVKLFDTIPSGPRYYLKELCAIALYTGARIEEIASLDVTDIDLKKRAIHIREGKTASAVRDIPVHRQLLPVLRRLIGKRTEGQLFESYKPAGRDRKLSHEASKRFGYWRNQNFPDTLHTDPTTGRSMAEVNFHSFRRTLINACEEAGIPETTTQQLVGHTKAGLAYGTYSKGISFQALLEVIDQLDFKGISL